MFNSSDQSGPFVFHKEKRRWNTVAFTQYKKVKLLVDALASIVTIATQYFTNVLPTTKSQFDLILRLEFRSVTHELLRPCKLKCWTYKLLTRDLQPQILKKRIQGTVVKLSRN